VVIATDNRHVLRTLPQQPLPRRSPHMAVIPANAGIQLALAFAPAVAFTRVEAWKMDPGFRRDDGFSG